MKFIRYPLFFILHLSFFILLAVGCSSIDADQRLDFVPPPTVSRAVLIEDFTGQMCLNCPNAHHAIQQLQLQYGADTVIAVSIHGGQLALFSRNNVTGLRTQVGDDYTAYWNVNSWPVGLINRRGGLQTEDKWAGLVHEQLELSSSVLLKAETTYYADTRSASVTVSVTAIDDIDAQLQLWLVEDSITALQRLPDGSLSNDYIHNGVLRAAVNGEWGTPLSLASGQTMLQTFTAGIDPSWIAEHVAVVAFVYSADGVEQVIHIPII